MLFPRRTWSARVIEKMDLPIRSKEATVLIELLIWASKQDTQMMNNTIGKALPPADLILFWAGQMRRNASAVRQVANEAGISIDQAEVLLEKMRLAGRAVAVEHGKQKLVEIIDRS